MLNKSSIRIAQIENAATEERSLGVVPNDGSQTFHFFENTAKNAVNAVMKSDMFSGTNSISVDNRIIPGASGVFQVEILLD
ncbi:hypothetical protein [Oceanobacillus sp. J11TS1]|uniref:hypothetical protein n=1 Tax=Oceanobacillus sp. J11TS1 TaxID=2807191 RepID=UPI001B2885C2|nr:hypothetical protein [Oceanobacillus sp. J11TS1]GIO23685.1 hypothetical protein J11TS1_22660 [Oceanobacillus sp. J11TS1]